MKLSIFGTATLLMYTGLLAPANTQNTAQVKPNNSLVQVQPTPEQVLNGCVQNQVETLPTPFSDVPSDHWAYKAVLTMYYGVAYREATPSNLLANRRFIKVNAKKVNYTKK